MRERRDDSRNESLSLGPYSNQKPSYQNGGAAQQCGFAQCPGHYHSVRSDEIDANGNGTSGFFQGFWPARSA